METVKISVIICTYNPVEHVFARCLQSITDAAKLCAPAEIIIVDNNSSTPLNGLHYITSFSRHNRNVRVIDEPKQGLTAARLTGIRNSTGNLLVFVDDDNFLDNDYFSVARDIYLKYPFIGAYSGRVTLEYDREPEPWTRRYWGMLIHRTLDKDVWSNLHFNNDTMPNGAGMCVSRDAADFYLQLYRDGKRSFDLDRSEQSLLSGGDNDIAMCACDIGKGMGLFKDLHLRHYIPQKRFSLDYLSRLAYGIYYSFAVLSFMRTGKTDSENMIKRVKGFIRFSLMKKEDREIQKACKKGLRDALLLIESGRISRQ